MRGALAFTGGAVAGLVLWWVLWYPLVAIGVFPDAWHHENGEIVIDDLWLAIGKVVGLPAIPVALGLVARKTALGIE